MDYVEIPVFTGEKLRPWLDWMERHFLSQNFTDMEKLCMSYGFIEGEALRWYHRRQKLFVFWTWNSLKNALLLKFGEDKDLEKTELQLANTRFWQQIRQRKVMKKKILPQMEESIQTTMTTSDSLHEQNHIINMMRVIGSTQGGNICEEKIVQEESVHQEVPSFLIQGVKEIENTWTQNLSPSYAMGENKIYFTIWHC